MSIARLLHRFLRRKSDPVDALLHGNPLLKLLVFSGAVSPHIHPPSYPTEPPYYVPHTTYHHFLTVEPCFQTIPPSSPMYDTTGHHNSSLGLLDWNGIMWAVPKKRTSHMKKRTRMTHKYLKPKHHYTVCPNCNNLKLLHVLCGHCLKETLRLTAEMRRAQIEQKLGWRDVDGNIKQQASTSETAR